MENSFNKVRKVPSSKVRKEIEEIEEQLGEVKVTQKGERPFSERVVDPIEEEKWFDPKVSLVSPYEVSARRGDPRYMRIDTIPGRDKQILFSGRNNEVPLYTRDEIINRVKESPNSPFWHHPDNNNIQTDKEIGALGIGGIFGVGLGNIIIKVVFLPEVHSEFIFNFIVE